MTHNGIVVMTPWNFTKEKKVMKKVLPRTKPFTKAELAKIDAARKHWQNVGTCTDPADRATTERIITGFYKRIGCPAPKFVWFNGPMECCIEGAKLLNTTPRQVFQRRWLDAEYCWWIAWYSTAQEVGVVYDQSTQELLDMWKELVNASGWWFPFKDICLCAERHKTVSLDEQGRMHSENGPAIECRDGYKVFSWHGTRVPERLIMDPMSYTKKEIRAIRNTEITRALAEKMGWTEYLNRLGTKKKDSWVDPVTGLSYELHVAKISGDAQFIKKQSSVLKDGSQPYYIEPVPTSLKSAQAARKWQAMAAFLSPDDEDGALQLAQHCNEEPELVYAWEA
jgi:hypothetical protein